MESRVQIREEAKEGGKAGIRRKSVTHGVHLIPAFSYGTTQELLGPTKSIAHSELEDEDHLLYYLDMCV